MRDEKISIYETISGTKMEKDPVCGMNVNIIKRKKIFVSKYEEKIFYFCSRRCKINFDKNPSNYIQD